MYHLGSATLQTTRDYQSVSLPTGDMEVFVERADLPLTELCGIAARRNPKRGFFFVSKVLGRHTPARPSAMMDIHRRLAEKIPGDLPGPVLVIGMAEAATCLGQGVYDQYARLTGRWDILFMQTTRYRLNKPTAVEFLEEHSHAAEHILYMPEGQRNQALFANARSVVIVDDEASTGKTFVNLAKELAANNTNIEAIVTAVITDWKGHERSASVALEMPAPLHQVSILEGRYVFHKRQNLPEIEMPNAKGNNEHKDYLLTGNTGRLGISNRKASTPIVNAALKSLPRISSSEKVLVLGTGEFSFLPFMVAERLEQAGGDIWCQSTTRSPVMLGDVITSAIAFDDNYDDGIINYLYNASPGQYDKVILFHETLESSVDLNLCAQLDTPSFTRRLTCLGPV